MSKSETILIAVGGGELAEAGDVLETYLKLVKDKSEARIVVMTVATSEPEEAAKKYDALFRKHKIKHVGIVDVLERGDCFSEAALNKIRSSDALFFTGGDQINVTSLIGGTPLHNLLHDRAEEGFIIAGTSAGAMMMSTTMITSGRDNLAPRVDCIDIAPGMDLIRGTIIDTHFSQRGRHGRLLTAVAHYPQDLGIGIDERTAIIVRGDELEVLGEGVVTIIDGSQMKHNNLPYREKEEPLGLFGAAIHVLPPGYKFNLERREPISPKLKNLVTGQ